MIRVDGEVYRALQLLVGADVAKGNTLRKGTACLNLQSCNRHVAPPLLARILFD